MTTRSRMFLTCFAISCLLLGCSPSTVHRPDPGTPQIYMKFLSQDRPNHPNPRMSAVHIALWDTGRVVWNSDGVYMTAMLDKAELADHVRNARSLALMTFSDRQAYAYPDGGWWEIRIQRADGSLADYIWDERGHTLPPGFADAWTLAKEMLKEIRPAQGTRLTSQPEAMTEFERFFPGIIIQ